ncbi:MAG: hypothetical protein JXB20_06335, partial [Bacilli bacterium]|nr:hypothetical protein [Bacilli bacterium]
FLVDGIRQNPVHHRYDTPFIHQKDSSEELVVEVDDLCLRLNLEKQLREETKGETYGKTQ